MYKGGDYIKRKVITLFLVSTLFFAIPQTANAAPEIIPYAGITAQINKYLLNRMVVSNPKEDSKPIKSKKFYVTGNCVNIRKESSSKSEVLSKVFFNDSVEVYETVDGYAKVKNGNVSGYISTDYISADKPKSKTFNVPYASMKTWMSYKTITSKSSKQYKLQKAAYTGNYGIRMVNNRYCVALGSHFDCEIGQFFDLVLNNGEIIPCIMGDMKANIHTDANNIITVASNCLSEFIVDSNELHKLAKRDGNISSCTDLWDSHVVKIIVYEKGEEL